MSCNWLKYYSETPLDCATRFVQLLGHIVQLFLSNYFFASHRIWKLILQSCRSWDDSRLVGTGLVGAIEFLSTCAVWMLRWVVPKYNLQNFTISASHYHLQGWKYNLQVSQSEFHNRTVQFQDTALTVLVLFPFAFIFARRICGSGGMCACGYRMNIL